ncbi:hypothetical protein B0A49_09053 [Cryomyces minteri]|uniref:C2H2-type domain-containing protein n=1 Tax=Cryomyces minteri TaxID=331657 RepID=A0A4U0WCE3_9PEZI|nr:hypothetical protein B0A49_09053 [Cryomyces minteri]
MPNRIYQQSERDPQYCPQLGSINEASDYPWNQRSFTGQAGWPESVDQLGFNESFNRNITSIPTAWNNTISHVDSNRSGSQLDFQHGALGQVPQAVPSRTPHDAYPDPLMRFYRISSDDPFSAERHHANSLNFQSDPSGFPYSHGRTRLISDQHRGAPQSTNGSFTAGQASDSGYHSQTVTTQSVRSGEPNNYVPECPDLLWSLNAYQPFQDGVEPAPNSPHPLAPERSQHGNRPKTPSDFRKHMLQHDKPHKCTVPYCKRLKGFPTTNDLDRHKYSVHKIVPTTGKAKVFKCAGDNCKARDKVWVRPDNFRAHIKRMHRGQDEEDLVARSLQNATATTQKEEQPAPALPLSSTLDPTLAGMNPADHQQHTMADCTDPMDLQISPDPAPRWTSFNGPAQIFRFEDAQEGESGVSPSLSVPLLPSADPREHQTRSQSNNSFRQNGSRAAMKVDNVNYENSLRLSTLAAVATASEPSHAGQDLQSCMRPASPTPPADVQVDLGNPDQTVSVSANMPSELQQKIKRLVAEFTKKKGKQSVSSNSNGNSSSTPETSIRCRFGNCTKVLFRECDMRKHMKRHNRPYGCTFPECNKKFGSKNDWKRHENSQHFQLGTWRCHEPNDSAAGPCAALFYYREPFEKHLKVKHNYTGKDQIHHQVTVRHIGRNGQVRFWCGFCKDILKLKETGVKAWDERFKHIDNHFIKDHKKIEDWLCVKANKTKAEVAKIDRGNFEDLHTEDDVAFSSLSAARGRPPTSPQNEVVVIDSESEPGNTTTASATRKRRRGDDHSDRPRGPPGRRTWSRYCCKCDAGPYLLALYSRCGPFNEACNHEFCSNCPKLSERIGANDAFGADEGGQGG